MDAAGTATAFIYLRQSQLAIAAAQRMIRMDAEAARDILAVVEENADALKAVAARTAGLGGTLDVSV